MNNKEPGQDQNLKKNEGSPSSLLNNDILQYIFVLLAHDPSRNEEDWNWYAVAHVCRHWRTIALDTSTFWSNLLCHSTSLETINLQLSRSKTADLSLACLQPFYTVCPVRIDEILAAVFAHRERITNMYIKTYGAIWDDFQEYVRPLPRNLDTLHVEILYKDLTPSSNLAPVSFRNVLSLKDLRSLHIINMTLRSASFPVNHLKPLTNLTELAFNNVIFEWRHLREVLRLSPNIQNLSVVSAPVHRITEFEEIIQDSGVASLIQLASLREIKIHGLATIHAHALFQSLDVPPSANWELRCLAPSFLNFQPDNDTLWSHQNMIRSLFNRHQYCEALHISLDEYAIQFRTESVLEFGDARDDRTISTTSFILDHQLPDFTYTNDERCVFLTHLIRTSHWRNTNTFLLNFKPGADEITKDKWADLLRSFDNLSSLEILLPTRQSQAEFSFALKYTGEHDVLKKIETLSFKLTCFNESFIENITSFLGDVRHKRGKISKIQIEYPKEAKRHDSANIQNLTEVLSEYAQEVQVDMYRSMRSMCFSE